MALESLLPSEVARLIYGYLVEEKCFETEKTFLNESPNLQECRIVLSHGRHFTTRVCGYTLLNILEKFCIVNSIVQEMINKLDTADKLRHCYDIIDQIKLLVEEYKGQQNSSTDINESFKKSHKKHYSSFKDDYKLKEVVEISDKKDKTQMQTNFNPVIVEATLLQNLPGYIKELQTKKYETIKLLSPKQSKQNLKLENNFKNKELVKNTSSKEINSKNEHLHNKKYEINKYANSEVQTGEAWFDELNLDINNVNDEKLKNFEVQTFNSCSNDTQTTSTNQCIELLCDFTFKLLNRTEIHEIIANNINKILEPIKPNLQKEYNKEAKEESKKSFIVELNKAVEIAVNKTESDPKFLNLINEIIPQNEKILNEEDELEVDNRNVNKFKEKNELHSKEKVSRDSIPLGTINSKIINHSLFCDVQNTNKMMTLEQINLSRSEKCFTKASEIKPVDLIKNNSTILANVIQNSQLDSEKPKTQLIESTNIDLNPLELPILQQKSAQKSNNLFSYNNVTSTPIKTCTSIQNFDMYDWFLPHHMLKPNIIYQKDDTVIPTKRNTHSACETIRTTVASHLSPIISKETAEVPERITAISYLSTNAIKEQTLETPDIYSPKNKVSNNISSTFPTNILPKQKIPFLQKSTEVLDELLNLHSSQKPNGNIDSLSPLLKDNNEYNRYFSIESIMLYGMDNNISTVKTPLSVPEIEVDDSVTLTGTGLSPFLKIHKRLTDVTDNIKEKNDYDFVQKIIDKKINESQYIIARNDNEILNSCTEKKFDNSHEMNEENDKELLKNISQIIMKHTPKKTLQDNSKNNHLSLSTPKKASNYVRALNFSTPINRSYSESKMKDKQLSISPETIKKNLKNSCKSSLFQSPIFSNSNIIYQHYTDIFRKIDSDSKNLIAINQEKHKLDAAKENENSIFNPNLKDISFLEKHDKPLNANKNVKKKVWDSDLRKCLRQYENNNINDLSKKNHKKKIKKQILEKETSKIKNNNNKLMKIRKNLEDSKSEKLKEIENSKNVNDVKKGVDETTIFNTEILKDKQVKIVKDLLDILSDNKNSSETVKEESLLNLVYKEMNILTKINKSNNNKINDDKNKIETILEKNLLNGFGSNENLKAKEYNNKINQELLESKNLMDYKNIEEQLSIITNTSIKNNSQNLRSQVIYDQVSRIEQGKIVQKKYARLKTLDTNISKSSFDSIKKHSPLNDFAVELEMPQMDENTLLVPPTPQVLSPGSNSVMMPISKVNEDSRTIQSLVTSPLECPLTPKIVLTPAKTTCILFKDSEKPTNTSYFEPTLNSFEVSVKKCEITQFEVIKENLLKNKKVITQPDSKAINDNATKLNDSILYREKEINFKNDASFTSSSYTCGSCSSSNKEETTKIMKNDDNKIKEVKKCESIRMNLEVSPIKVFLINKTDKEIENFSNETPAKIENACTEAEIFETPSISKVIEPPKNLNTNISHMMMLKEKENNKKNTKLNIINNEHISSSIMTMSPDQLLKSLPLSIQTRTLDNKKSKNVPAAIQSMKMKKSEEEVAKAVKSIIVNDKKTINQNENTYTDNTILDSSTFNNNVKSNTSKIELVKAIESIIKDNYVFEPRSFFKSTDSNDESANENIQLVLKEDNILPEMCNTENCRSKEKRNQNNSSSPHQHNTRFKSRQIIYDEKNVSVNNSNILSNCTIPCQEIQYVFDDDNFKRKRRKTFSNAELTWEFQDEIGNLMNTIAPSALDIIFQINPPRKKASKSIKVSKKEKSAHVEDVIISKDSISNHINNNNPILNAKTVMNDKKELHKISNKRKRIIESENTVVYRKRKKNMFIL